MDTLGWRIGDRFIATGPQEKYYKGMVLEVEGFDFTSNYKGELCLKCNSKSRGLHHTYCQKISRDENSIEPQVF